MTFWPGTNYPWMYRALSDYQIHLKSPGGVGAVSSPGAACILFPKSLRVLLLCVCSSFPMHRRYLLAPVAIHTRLLDHSKKMNTLLRILLS